MIEANSRNYNCKDEELPVIGNKVLFSLNRDATDFVSYSPKFDDGYITGFDVKIQQVFD